MVKKKENCCKGATVEHIFALVGMYILTWGLIGSAGFSMVIGSPIFWGLFLIGMSLCGRYQKK
jgi:hypothetical protein